MRCAGFDVVQMDPYRLAQGRQRVACLRIAISEFQDVINVQRRDLKRRLAVCTPMAKTRSVPSKHNWPPLYLGYHLCVTTSNPLKRFVTFPCAMPTAAGIRSKSVDHDFLRAKEIATLCHLMFELSAYGDCHKEIIAVSL